MFDYPLALFTELEKKHDFVVKMRDVVTSLPRPVFIVMRYLFAFLNQWVEGLCVDEKKIWWYKI